MKAEQLTQTKNIGVIKDECVWVVFRVPWSAAVAYDRVGQASCCRINFARFRLVG